MIPRSFYRALAAGLVMLGAVAGFAAVPSMVTGPVGSDEKAGVIDMGGDAAAPRKENAIDPGRATAGPRDQTPTGNPLWAIPLRELSATRERPIFSPSRRPPPPAVVAAPYVVAQAVSKPVEPERPRLALVGTIASASEAFGIFLDQADNKIVRLKMGEGHRGWILLRVLRREVTLQKDKETALLALPAANEASAPASQVTENGSERRGRR